MSGSTVAVISAILGLVGGTAVGAWLTGLLTIRQKQIARRQKRRAAAYAEALAWITSCVTNHGAAAPAATPTGPFTNAKFFHAGALGGGTGLDSAYFMTLRAQIMTFGSHDVARAFDRWVYAYRKVQAGEGDATWDLPAAADGASSVLAGMKFSDAIFPSAEDPVIGTSNPKRWPPDAGHPEKRGGSLTRAIECCVSYELRLG